MPGVFLGVAVLLQLQGKCPAIGVHDPRPIQVIGPGLLQADVSAGKNTRFGRDERFNLQIRWEAFNFFNRANYNQPNVVVNVASPAFGSITSAARAREMQFGMRLEF